MELTRTDKRILKVLSKGGLDSVSTYQIAKKANISWSTTISHCYKLMISDIVEGEEIESNFWNEKAIV